MTMTDEVASSAMVQAADYTRVWANAHHRLTAAGCAPDLAEYVCAQAAIDHPGYGPDWAAAVAGDVEQLCADPAGLGDEAR